LLLHYSKQRGRHGRHKHILKCLNIQIWLPRVTLIMWQMWCS